jgi:hypothetical protein
MGAFCAIAIAVFAFVLVFFNGGIKPLFGAVYIV